MELYAGLGAAQKIETRVASEHATCCAGRDRENPCWIQGRALRPGLSKDWKPRLLHVGGEEPRMMPRCRRCRNPLLLSVGESQAAWTSTCSLLALLLLGVGRVHYPFRAHCSEPVDPPEHCTECGDTPCCTLRPCYKNCPQCTGSSEPLWADGAEPWEP